MSCMDSETRLALMNLKGKDEPARRRIEASRFEAGGLFKAVAVGALFVAFSLAASLGL